ncbi:MAG TPA: SURF1 family protein [Caulobacter sp.]|nr:SURF1 family protein [Caulobacter sp.]
MKRFPLVLTVFTAAALAILLWLGTWQLQRMAWKAHLLARIEANKAAPPVPLETLDLAAPDTEFRRATLTCPPQAFARQIELHGLVDGAAVRRLVIACPTGRGAILVDLGYVAETISARPGPPAVPARIEGVLRRPDAPGLIAAPAPQNGLWYGRDIPAMAKALGVADPAPVFLFASALARPDWQALKPAPLPAAIANRHLEYALTWYGLAGALLAIYGAMLWRRFKAPKAQ